MQPAMTFTYDSIVEILPPGAGSKLPCRYVLKGDGVPLLTITGLTARESAEELARLMTGVYNMGRANPNVLNPFAVNGANILCRGVSLGAKVPFVSPMATAGLLNLAYALGAGRLCGVTSRREVKRVLSGKPSAALGA